MKNEKNSIISRTMPRRLLFLVPIESEQQKRKNSVSVL